MYGWERQSHCNRSWSGGLNLSPTPTSRAQAGTPRDPPQQGPWCGGLDSTLHPGSQQQTVTVAAALRARVWERSYLSPTLCPPLQDPSRCSWAERMGHEGSDPTPAPSPGMNELRGIPSPNSFLPLPLPPPLHREETLCLFPMADPGMGLSWCLPR